MSDLLSRLLRATSWGAALAAGASCGGQTEPSASGGPADAAVESAPDAEPQGDATADVTPADADTSDAPLPTTPYPEPAGCSGPSHDGGYYGQCCEVVGCGDPVDGACPAPDQLYGKVSNYPPGSGSCTCGEPTRGPFAPHDAGQKACCYLFGTISCEGRPLVVRGEARLAPLASRGDWGLAATRGA